MQIFVLSVNITTLQQPWYRKQPSITVAEQIYDVVRKSNLAKSGTVGYASELLESVHNYFPSLVEYLQDTLSHK